MIATKGYAVSSPKSRFEPFRFERREIGENDVLIHIDYCGICHSDIHQVRDEWGGSIYPMVPGHEIVGHVVKAGAGVTKFKVGDLAGVGCFVDSCRHCPACREGDENNCEEGFIATYNGLERDGKTPTYGGYSSQIVVDEKYTLKVPTNLELARVAPLLCAGITTYSPLKQWKVKKGDAVAVVGLGGLGHMAVKLAVSMGADVTVLSTSPRKEGDAKKLGAHHFISTANPEAFKKHRRSFNFILDTVSATHDYNAYLGLLKSYGVMCLVGLPTEAVPLEAFSVVGGRKVLTGSNIGNIHETQEMLDYCSRHNIASDIEMIPIQDLEKAYERVIKGDVRYRFVIDMKSLA